MTPELNCFHLATHAIERVASVSQAGIRLIAVLLEVRTDDYIHWRDFDTLTIYRGRNETVYHIRLLVVSKDHSTLAET